MQRNDSRNTKRNRDRRYKEKLKRLYKVNSWMVSKRDPEDDFCRRDITKVYYKRFYWTNGVKKWLRRQSNKAIRNATFDEIPMKGCGYKKKYDLWWELY